MVECIIVFWEMPRNDVDGSGDFADVYAVEYFCGCGPSASFMLIL